MPKLTKQLDECKVLKVLGDLDAWPGYLASPSPDPKWAGGELQQNLASLRALLLTDTARMADAAVGPTRGGK
jgi:hypothetical protein